MSAFTVGFPTSVEDAETDTEARFVRLDTDVERPGFASIRTSMFRLDDTLRDDSVTASLTKTGTDDPLFDGAMIATENAVVFEMDSVSLDDVVGWLARERADRWSRRRLWRNLRLRRCGL
ncbi:MAG: hypothetical protein ACJAYU_001545 [Bradymonadia bacterium]